MTNINPFEKLFNDMKIGQSQGVNAPGKADEAKSAGNEENTHGAGIEHTNEDELVDNTSMIDDTADLDMSDFSKNQDNKDEILKEANEMVSDLIDKKQQ